MPDGQPAENTGADSSPRTTTLIPLVGRTGIVNEIGALLRSARSAGGRLLIQGESGEGKSRLLAEAARMGRERSFEPLLIPCRGAALTPYQPVGRLVETVLHLNPSQPLADRLTAARVVLAKHQLTELIPTITSLLDPKPGITLSIESLATMTLRLFGLMADENRIPLLLVDDLDEAGPVMPRWLAAIQNQARGLPMCLIATASRDAEEEITLMFGPHAVQAGDLDRSDSLQLGAACLGTREVGPQLGEWIWKRSAGRPLFIHWLCEALREGAAVQRDPKGQVAEIEAEPAVPHVGEYLQLKLRNLPTHLRRVLLGLAVAGNGSTLETLAALLGEPDWAQISQAGGELVEAGWLRRSSPGREPCFAFSNRFTQSAIYERMNESQRQEMHQKVAIHLSQNGLKDPQRVIGVAGHYQRSGDTARGLEVIEEGLSYAYQSGDRMGVMQLLESGIPLAASDHTLHKRQAALVEKLGDLYAVDGDYETAARVYREMGPSISSMSLLTKLGLVQLPSDPERATHTLAQIASLIPQNHPEDLRWYAESGLVMAYGLMGQTYQAVRRSRDTLASLGDTMGFGTARTLLRGTLGIVLFMNNEREDALAHLESARAGWGARGLQEGVLLINQVIIESPRDEITRNWLKMTLKPMLGDALALRSAEAAQPTP